MSNLNTQIAADLATFIDSTYGFAVVADFDGDSIDGIFEDPYAEQLDIEGTAPVLYCISTAVAGKIQGDEVTINGVDYTIAGVQPDGTGITKITLEKAD